jgi:arylsulfatase A-like enzyme
VKGQLYEGGVRVPFLVQWKGNLPAGRVCDVPVSSLDITATALAVAGIEPDESLDGVDFIPLLLGNADGERALFWRVGGQSAVRLGEWKLVSRPGKPAELYNLDTYASNSKTGAPAWNVLAGRPVRSPGRKSEATKDKG